MKFQVRPQRHTLVFRIIVHVRFGFFDKFCTPIRLILVCTFSRSDKFFTSKRTYFKLGLQYVKAEKGGLCWLYFYIFPGHAPYLGSYLCLLNYEIYLCLYVYSALYVFEFLGMWRYVRLFHPILLFETLEYLMPSVKS